MKDKCSKYKEQIMEMADGELPESAVSPVRQHVKSCPECAKYEKELIKMAKITASLRVEAPAFAETRIMAAIKPAVKPSFSFIHALSYATSFALILIVATLIIYKPAGGPKSDLAVIKDAPVVADIKTKVSAPKTAAVKPVVVPKTEEKPAVVAVVPQKAPEAAIPAAVEQSEQVAAVPDNRNTAGKNIAAADKPAEAVKQANYGVDTFDSAGSITAAKVTPVPTEPGIPLLATDKAIVANNVINPRLGQGARIVIQVDEPARCVIRIYDERVRKVAEILDEEKAAGKYEAMWYGKNDSGSTVSEGAYFVYIQIGTRVVKKSIMVIKN